MRILVAHYIALYHMLVQGTNCQTFKGTHCI